MEKKKESTNQKITLNLFVECFVCQVLKNAVCSDVDRCNLLPFNRIRTKISENESQKAERATNQRNMVPRARC